MYDRDDELLKYHRHNSKYKRGNLFLRFVMFFGANLLK